MIFKSGMHAAAHRRIAHQRASLLAAGHGYQGRDVYYTSKTLGGPARPAPMLYLDVHPDGTRQLVRGAVFDELDTRSLRSDILAAGDDAYVDNTLGTVPTTTIAPSLLFDDIGVKRASAEQQKLPYYPHPHGLRQNTVTGFSRRDRQAPCLARHSGPREARRQNRRICSCLVIPSSRRQSQGS